MQEGPPPLDTVETRRRWQDCSGAYSPAYYAHYGPNEVSERLATLLSPNSVPKTPVLEIGCSSGRHLAHLHEQGFSDVSGVELNPDAAHVMHTQYPDLANACTLYVDAIENVIESFDDNQFAAVYTVETLQHLHPDVTWVFEEIARITDHTLITVETEADVDSTVVDGLPLYYRDYQNIFTDAGLDHVHAEPPERGTLRVFDATNDS